MLIPPFDHPDVIAGQGTLGLEILEQVPDATTIIVPIGGGGLIAGIASAAKQQAAREGRTVRVIGVQAENAAPYSPSLAAGEPRQVPVVPTIADGIAVYRPGRAELRDHPRARSTRSSRSAKTTSPGRCSCSSSAPSSSSSRPARSRVAAILTGAVPTDGPDRRRAARAATSTRCSWSGSSPRARGLGPLPEAEHPLPDRPGQLARIAELIAEANANVVEVLHTRHGSGLQISEVELELSVETRGPEHATHVVEVLRDAGYEPTRRDRLMPRPRGDRPDDDGPCAMRRGRRT